MVVTAGAGNTVDLLRRGPSQDTSVDTHTSSWQSDEPALFFRRIEGADGTGIHIYMNWGEPQQ